MNPTREQAMVDKLDAASFNYCARVLLDALENRYGVRVYLCPGDATRYRVEVGPATAVTITERDVTSDNVPITDVPITFGTDTDVHTAPIGRARHDLLPKHLWTRAVWARLVDLLSEAGVPL